MPINNPLGFNLPHLKEELRGLPGNHRAAFAASCAERLFPNYVAFWKSEGWGDPDTLRHALDLAWNRLEGDNVSDDVLEEYTEKCEPLIPDTDDFSSGYVSAALDAATAIVETLACCKDKSEKRAAEVASVARDTVDLYVQDIENFDPRDSELEQKIADHWLMIRELKKQRDDLDFLNSTKELTTAKIMQLRHSWQNNGKSNIDLG